jgi:hypothetical protein
VIPFGSGGDQVCPRARDLKKSVDNVSLLAISQYKKIVIWLIDG